MVQKQKHVAYLGSFNEDNVAQDNARAWFWQGARKRLDQLGICGRITNLDREKDRGRARAACAANGTGARGGVFCKTE